MKNDLTLKEWMERIKHERRFYKVLEGHALDQDALKQMYEAGLTPIEALNVLTETV